MVRENSAAGLRERLWFGQLLLQQLESRQAEEAPWGELLALRGAVCFHLYSVLVGLVRHAAQSHGLPEAEQCIALPVIERLLAEQGIVAAEVELVQRARQDRGDVVHWLEQQVLQATGAGGLARRPPPRGENDLSLTAEDPFAILSTGDLERLRQAVQAVRRLLEEAAPYLEEW